jgi:hypothetical protein
VQAQTCGGFDIVHANEHSPSSDSPQTISVVFIGMNSLFQGISLGWTAEKEPWE